MRQKYILALFLFLFLIIFSWCLQNTQNEEIAQVKEVYNSDIQNQNFVIEEIKEEKEKYSIEVYYPRTNYENLNNAITDNVKGTIDLFKKEVESLSDISLSAKLTLNINYTIYEYLDYISVAIDNVWYLGGAHPNERINTIVYNKKEEKLFTIDDLISKNKTFLKDISVYSYNSLKDNEKIKKYSTDEMLRNGTEPLKDNFKNFVLTDTGLLIIFNKYDIAPYVAGNFEIRVPYTDMNIEL